MRIEHISNQGERMNETVIKIVFDAAQLEKICAAIRDAVDYSTLNIVLHDESPGLNNLCDAISSIGDKIEENRVE